jgi:hypothetical protein
VRPYEVLTAAKKNAGFPKLFCGGTYCALRACFVPQKKVHLAINKVLSV